MNTDKPYSAVDTRDDEVEFDPFKPVSYRRGGGGVAWLALLLVLGLAAWNGWQWWQGQRGERAAQVTGVQLDRLANALDASSQRLNALETAVEQGNALAERLQQLETASREGAIDEQSLQSALVAARADLAELRGKLDETQAALAALAARQESPGQRVELAEVAFLLRAANERLQLFGDSAGADRALALADAQLAALDDPLYLPVRQAIAAARLELESMPRIDTVALTERLGQLQARVPMLAIKGEHAPAALPQEPAPDAVEPGLWARFKATLAGLVTVRRRAEAEPLFSLEDKDYLRQGLWLQLEAARLALLRGDTEAWGETLGRARTALENWFEVSDAQVQAAMQDIGNLRDTSLAVNYPDLSSPWRVLNGLRAAPAAVEPAEEAVQ